MNTLIRKKEGGAVYAITGDLYRVVASGKETDGKFALLDAVVSPHAGPPPHVHANEDEMFFVTEGEVTFSTQGKTVTLGPGEFLAAPRNIPHVFRNNTDQPARMLIQVMPAGLEEYFAECAMPYTAGSPVPAPTKEHIDRLIALAPKYGLQFVERV